MESSPHYTAKHKSSFVDLPLSNSTLGEDTLSGSKNIGVNLIPMRYTNKKKQKRKYGPSNLNPITNNVWNDTNRAMDDKRIPELNVNNEITRPVTCNLKQNTISLSPIKLEYTQLICTLPSNKDVEDFLSKYEEESNEFASFSVLSEIQLDHLNYYSNNHVRSHPNILETMICCGILGKVPLFLTEFHSIFLKVLRGIEYAIYGQCLISDYYSNMTQEIKVADTTHIKSCKENENLLKQNRKNHMDAINKILRQYNEKRPFYYFYYDLESKYNSLCYKVQMQNEVICKLKENENKKSMIEEIMIEKVESNIQDSKEEYLSDNNASQTPINEEPKIKLNINNFEETSRDQILGSSNEHNNKLDIPEEEHEKIRRRLTVTTSQNIDFSLSLLNDNERKQIVSKFLDSFGDEILLEIFHELDFTRQKKIYRMFQEDNGFESDTFMHEDSNLFSLSERNNEPINETYKNTLHVLPLESDDKYHILMEYFKSCNNEKKTAIITSLVCEYSSKHDDIYLLIKNGTLKIGKSEHICLDIESPKNNLKEIENKPNTTEQNQKKKKENNVHDALLDNIIEFLFSKATELKKMQHNDKKHVYLIECLTILLKDLSIKTVQAALMDMKTDLISIYDIVISALFSDIDQINVEKILGKYIINFIKCLNNKSNTTNAHNKINYFDVFRRFLSEADSKIADDHLKSFLSWFIPKYDVHEAILQEKVKTNLGEDEDEDEDEDLKSSQKVVHNNHLKKRPSKVNKTYRSISKMKVKLRKQLAEDVHNKNEPIYENSKLKIADVVKTIRDGKISQRELIISLLDQSDKSDHSYSDHLIELLDFLNLGEQFIFLDKTHNSKTEDILHLDEEAMNMTTAPITDDLTGSDTCAKKGEDISVHQNMKETESRAKEVPTYDSQESIVDMSSSLEEKDQNKTDVKKVVIRHAQQAVGRSSTPPATKSKPKAKVVLHDSDKNIRRRLSVDSFGFLQKMRTRHSMSNAYSTRTRATQTEEILTITSPVSLSGDKSDYEINDERQKSKIKSIPIKDVQSTNLINKEAIPRSFASLITSWKINSGKVSQSIKRDNMQSILKLISDVYSEYIFSNQKQKEESKITAKNLSVPQLVYRNLLNSFGLPSIADANLIALSISLYKLQKEHLRIRHFYLLCTEELDINHYFEFISVLLEDKFPKLSPDTLGGNTSYGLFRSRAGVSKIKKPNIFSEKKQWYFPVERCQEAISKCFQSMRESSVSSFSERIFNLSILPSSDQDALFEPYNKTDEGEDESTRYVDIDLLMENIINEWKEEKDRRERRLRAAFFAGDVNGDGCLSASEFISIVRSIDPNKTNQECLEMYSDVLRVAGCENITEEMFIEVSKTYGLIDASWASDSNIFSSIQDKESLVCMWDTTKAFILGTIEALYIDIPNNSDLRNCQGDGCGCYDCLIENIIGFLRMLCCNDNNSIADIANSVIWKRFWNVLQQLLDMLSTLSHIISFPRRPYKFIPSPHIGYSKRRNSLPFIFFPDVNKINGFYPSDIKHEDSINNLLRMKNHSNKAEET